MIVGPLGPLVSCRGALEEISNSVDELFRGTITWQISCNRLSMTDYWGELDYVAAQPHRCGSDGGTTQ